MMQKVSKYLFRFKYTFVFWCKQSLTLCMYIWARKLDDCKKETQPTINKLDDCKNETQPTIYTF